MRGVAQLKIEIWRGKRGESHKWMSKIGGEYACGAGTLDLLFHRLRVEVKNQFEIEEMCAPEPLATIRKRRVLRANKRAT